MLKDITLGQFFPGDSIVHKLDPRMKIILMSIYVAAVFFADTWLTFSLLILCTLALIIVYEKCQDIISIQGTKTL